MLFCFLFLQKILEFLICDTQTDLCTKRANQMKPSALIPSVNAVRLSQTCRNPTGEYDPIHSAGKVKADMKFCPGHSLR